MKEHLSNLRNLPQGLLCKCQNHEEDYANFCGLLRKTQRAFCRDTFLFSSTHYHFVWSFKITRQNLSNSFFFKHQRAYSLSYLNRLDP